MLVVAVPVFLAVIYFFFLRSVPEAAGQFGDFIGGISNPIFTFVSIIILVSGLIIQSEELKMTRQELKNSSDAQRENSNNTEKQNKITVLVALLQQKQERMRSVEFDIEVIFKGVQSYAIAESVKKDKSSQLDDLNKERNSLKDEIDILVKELRKWHNNPA
jgi:uncharacterized membrane protein